MMLVVVVAGVVAAHAGADVNGGVGVDGAAAVVALALAYAYY